MFFQFWGDGWGTNFSIACVMNVGSWGKAMGWKEMGKGERGGGVKREGVGGTTIVRGWVTWEGRG